MLIWQLFVNKIKEILLITQWSTGVAALLFAVFLFLDYLKDKEKTFHALWAVSFFILFAAGLLLVLFNDFELLLSPIISVLGALIPGGIAAGLFYTRTKKAGRIYLIFVLIVTLLIALTKFIIPLNDYAKYAVMLLHVPSGLTMVILPLLDYKSEGRATILASVGGVLMSVAGLLLAFLVLGFPILDMLTIFMILPLLLLLVAVCLGLGFLYTEKYSFKVPLLKP